MSGLDCPVNEITVKRLFLDDALQKDRFAIIRQGEHLAEISYPLARRFWLGRISLNELLQANDRAGGML